MVRATESGAVASVHVAQVAAPAPSPEPARLLPYAGEASSPDVQHLLAQMNAAYSNEDVDTVARIRGEIEALGYRA